MNWEAIGKLGTANLALIVIGVILYKQAEALNRVADALLEIARTYTGS